MSGAVGSLVFKLGELLKEEYKLQTGVPEQIRALIKELECAHATLIEVDKVPSNHLPSQRRIWAREIREASYDMEDVLDNLLVDNEGGPEHSDHGSLLQYLKEKMARLSMLVCDTVKRRKIAVTIDDINKRINEVTERYGRYTVNSIAVPGPASTSTVDPRLMAMYKKVSQLIGINKSRSELISMLSPRRDNESKKKMKMVSVVGGGGLGKTTLAKEVYNRLKVDFECTAFVPVGRKPDLINVLTDILIHLDTRKYLNLKTAQLGQTLLINELQEYLKDKRYFIVIDDVWEKESWETIKEALDENNNGSRLIVTTRISNVAEQADEIYKLKPLPSDQSKKLFYTRIFDADGTCPDSQLDEVYDKILKKCDGVPLAIITMASLLVGKSREEQSKVCTSFFRDKGNLQVSDTEWILSLSYYDLPDHLKSCSLYLSAFPEDYFIDKDTLIQKWAAEGFVHCEQGTGYFEVGEEYFNELINRSMIQPAESELCYGLIDGCRIHDMMLDLLREKSGEQNFFTVSDTNAEGTSSSSTVRRLAHQNRTVKQTHLDSQMDLSHMRTFIASRCDVYPGLSFLSFEFLRVLALEHCGGWEKDPPIHLKHIERLLHLRYLGLRATCIHELPEELGYLKYLQTLDLQETLVKELPESVGLLTQLIYLHARNAKIPNGVLTKMTSLEQLHIRVDEDTVEQFVKDLDRLRELRVLEVRFDGSDFFDERYDASWNAVMQDQALWDTVVLPGSIRHLNLNCMRFYALPSCINSSVLSNLSHLFLEVKALDEQGLKIVGGLRELRYLSLMTDSTVTVTIHASDPVFLNLKCLVVPLSMLQFVLNKDSSVSLTIWNGKDDMASGSKARGKSIVAPFRERCIVAPAVMLMRNLQMLYFRVKVQALVRNSGTCENLGLEYLPVLEKVQVDLWCYDASADDVNKEKAALWQAFQAHPNRPGLEINFLEEAYAYDDFVTEEQENSASSSGEGDPIA